MTRRVPSPRSLWAGRFHTAEILGRFSQPSRSLHTSLLKNPNGEILRVCKCDKSPSLYKETGGNPIGHFSLPNGVFVACICEPPRSPRTVLLVHRDECSP